MYRLVFESCSVQPNFYVQKSMLIFLAKNDKQNNTTKISYLDKQN